VVAALTAAQLADVAAAGHVTALLFGRAFVNGIERTDSVALAVEDEFADRTLTGLGVEPLRAEFVSRLGGSASVLGSSERHHRALERVLEHLTLARAAATVSTLEVVAGELALALDTLAELRGADASSELLDALFARFCIGK
jgi:tRNA modification GTPase